MMTIDVGILRPKLDYDRTIFIAVCMTFFFLPITITPALLAGLAAILLWIWSGRMSVCRDNGIGRIGLVVLILAILPWAGLLWSHDPIMGLKFARKSYHWVLAFVVASLVINEARVDYFVKAYVTGLMVSIVICYLQMFNVLPMYKSYTYGFMHYIQYSLMIVAGICLLAYLFARAPNITAKAGIVFLMCSCFYLLVSLKGRSGYIAFAVMLPWIMITMVGRRYFVRIVIVSMVILASLVASTTVRNRIGETFDDIAMYSQGSLNTSVGLRLYMWKGGVNIFFENPILGAGTGSYQVLLRRYKPASDTPDLNHPHNSFIYMASSFGLVGLCAVIWFFGELFFRGWRNRNNVLGIITISFIGVIFVGSFTDTHILTFHTGYLLALIAGLNMNRFVPVTS